MKNLFATIWFLFFITTILFSQTSDITFSVSTEKTQVYPNDIFEVVFTFEGDYTITKDHKLDFPSWDGLTRITGPYKSTRTSIINGQRSMAMSTHFSFIATDTGTYIFPPATCTYKDSIYSSQSIEINVLSPKLLTDSLLAEQIFLRTELYPAKALVGEQVRMDVRVYGRKLPDIHGYDFLEEPKVNGLHFGKDYREQNGKTNIMIDGELYPSYILMSKPIYAYHEGDFKIPRINGSLSIKKDTSDNYFFSFERKMVVTDPVKLKIVGLNGEDNKYPPVNGSKITCYLIDTAINSGLINIEVTVKGKGDPMFFTPPEIGLEKFAKVKLEKTTERISAHPYKFDNSRTFYYSISFFEIGVYDISPQWITWNTGTKDWKTIYAKSKTINIPSISSTLDLEEKKEEPKKNPISHDIIFTIDLSSSMLTQDIYPSRIDFVQDRIKEFLKSKSTSQRVGIVSFAGESKLICPLTSDLKLLTQAIDQIQIGKLEDGTAIGTGLIHSLQALSESTANQKTIVLLTDGNQNSNRFDPMFTSSIAQQEGVRILSFGIFSDEAHVYGPISKKGTGEYIFASKPNGKIDETALKAFSQKTNGDYLRELKPTSFDESLREMINSKYKNVTPNTSPIDQQLLDIYYQRFRLHQQ